MIENLSSLPPISAPSAGQRVGLVESLVQKLLTRQARVHAIEELSPKLRLITLQGEALRNVTWTPGDKIQVLLGGWIQRTYSPLDWKSGTGCARILVYLEAGGPGTQWVRTLRLGDSCAIFGPRKSIDLTRLQGPALFFGDETSLGLAWALKELPGPVEGVEYLFELSTPSESLPGMEFLGVDFAYVRADAQWPEVEARARALLVKTRSAEFVLSGKATSVQRLRKFLRNEGVPASHIHARAYWAAGKKGLD